MSDNGEQQYVDLVRRVLREGAVRTDRTGVGTRSIFGAQMRFDLRDNKFPLLTCKRVPFRLVAEELLWFVGGGTCAKPLQDKNVHIWDANCSDEFLRKRGLRRTVVNTVHGGVCATAETTTKDVGYDPAIGELGPIYGFQWRHFGAEYKAGAITQSGGGGGGGVDQLAQVVRLIREDPDSRRIILTAWNPCDLDKMALPPCHILAQFYVDKDKGELSCQLYQRSGDLGLGVPFNIASYSLLTCMLAAVCKLKPREFILTLGDAHVYSTHVEPLERSGMLTNSLRPPPTLHIANMREGQTIDNFTMDQFEVRDYHPHATVPMPMAV